MFYFDRHSMRRSLWGIGQLIQFRSSLDWKMKLLSVNTMNKFWMISSFIVLWHYRSSALLNEVCVQHFCLRIEYFGIYFSYYDNRHHVIWVMRMHSLCLLRPNSPCTAHAPCSYVPVQAQTQAYYCVNEMKVDLSESNLFIPQQLIDSDENK